MAQNYEFKAYSISVHGGRGAPLGGGGGALPHLILKYYQYFNLCRKCFFFDTEFREIKNK
jgi:hypothetical protein